MIHNSRAGVFRKFLKKKKCTLNNIQMYSLISVHVAKWTRNWMRPCIRKTYIIIILKMISLHRSSVFLMDAAGRIKRDTTGKSTIFCRIYILLRYWLDSIDTDTCTCRILHSTLKYIVWQCIVILNMWRYSTGLRGFNENLSYLAKRKKIHVI